MTISPSKRVRVRPSRLVTLAPNEHQIQSSFIDWMRVAWPGVVAFAIPNAAKRSPALAAWMRKEGMLAGIPDVMIARAASGYHGLFIEFKAGRNKPTPDQEETMQRLELSGYLCSVHWNVDSARDLVNSYLEGGVA